MNYVSEFNPDQMWSQVSLVPSSPCSRTGKLFETWNSRPASAMSPKKKGKKRGKKEVSKGSEKGEGRKECGSKWLRCLNHLGLNNLPLCVFVF